MNNIGLEDFLRLVNSYNAEELDAVKKAYYCASKLHDGQFRQSGEPYIIHPLNVAYILAEMHADRDTLCAGLLHDTLEDTLIIKDDIEELFNKDVADLVDGVTKLSKMNFSSKEEMNFANTRKIITSIRSDVRIIIIKLADRLHNMRTLQYKSPYKQKENAIETLEIFVPLAYYIGAYRIKSELEDISFRYLKPDNYKELEKMKLNIEGENNICLKEMLYKINEILDSKDIPHNIKIRTKNIYGIYKKLEAGLKISDIHDLLALKIMVDNIDNCYRTLGLIHNEYHPVNSDFKDYICNPKTNMYQSLHTTVFGLNERLVQTQIRTFDMDNIASFGLTAYWDINKGEARKVMQEDLKNKYQFFKSLVQIDKVFDDNKEFVNKVKSEVFSDKVYVYTTKGDVVELPLGSTPIDFAYKVNPELGNKISKVLVNDEEVSLNYILKDNDRLKIITNNLNTPNKEWLEFAKTSYARKKIKDYEK